MQLMIHRIHSTITNNKVLLENFSYLSLLQIFNLLLPLITYPYLIRILGNNNYGKIIYSQAIIGYFVMLVNFGFNIIGTKEISVNRKNIFKINEIISSIQIIKFILLIISFVLLTLLITFVSSIKEDYILLYLTMWMCVYDFIFPMYYFQGVEKMKFITYITLSSRVIFLLLIFILIKKSDDYLFVPVINGFGALIAGVVSIILLYKDNVKFKIQSFSMIFYYLKKSYVMALAYASNSLKSNLNIILVQLLFSYKEVAYFDLALKISNIGNTFLDLISQTVFPKMSREKNKFFLRKIIIISLVLSAIYILLIQVFAIDIIVLLGGVDMQPSINLLRILVFFIPIYIVGALLGRNGLIVHGYDKYILYSMFYSSLIFTTVTLSFVFFQVKISLIVLTLFFILSYLFETLYRLFLCSKKCII